MMRWKETTLNHGARAGKQRLITVRCSVGHVMLKRQTNIEKNIFNFVDEFADVESLFMRAKLMCAVMLAL